MQPKASPKGTFVYYLTALWALLIVAIGLYSLSASMKPTADIESQPQVFALAVSIEDWKPGDAQVFSHKGIPFVVWRRDPTEMAIAAVQVYPETSVDQWTRELKEGTLAQTIGAEAYDLLEWFVTSPRNSNGSKCMVTPKAGQFGGFLDPCSNVHFDMWGRAKIGPLRENLKILPTQFSADRKHIFFDISNMPSTE